MKAEPRRFPPVLFATCTVPWDDGYRFEEETFRRDVRRRAAATRHLYIFGTAGEGYAVSDDQFRTIATVFLDEARAAGAEPTIGVVSLSLQTILERIAWAREAGCRSFQLSFPSWGALRGAEVDAFFEATCGGFPDCSFHHYNQTRTKLLLGPDDYGPLASRHENLVGVKYSTNDADLLQACIDAAPELQFFPTEIGYALVRDRRECGLLASLSMVDLALAQRFHAARGAELAGLDARWRKVFEALLDSISPDAHMDGAFEKAISRLHDPGYPLRLLPPYRGATDESFKRFAARIASLR
jgi:dihydrodipicolinate synthase/N-acetylneuraminate lyase